MREFQWRGGVSETASTDDSPTIVEQIRASADRLTERERKAAQTLLNSAIAQVSAIVDVPFPYPRTADLRQG